VIERWPSQGMGTLLTVDLRGTGWSAKPADGYSLHDYTQDVVQLMEQQALHNLILVGHSMGGTIAMQVALERPAMLAGLILVSPVPPSGVPLSETDVAFFRSLGGRVQGAQQVLRMMMAAPPDGPVFQHLVDSAATVALAAFLGGFDAWRTASFADRVGQIKAPTMVFGGEKEQPLSPALLQEHVVAKIPGARFVGLPKVGHYPQVEDPDAFFAALTGAIREVPRGTNKDAAAPHK